MRNFIYRLSGIVVTEAILLFSVGTFNVPDDLRPIGYVLALVLLVGWVTFEIGKWFGEGPHHPERNISVDQAIRYIAFGSFKATFPPVEELTLVLRGNAKESLRERANDERLQVWGKPVGEVHFQKIPSEYWRTAQIDLLTLMHSEKPTSTERISNKSDFESYSELMLDRREVIKVWPGGWRRVISLYPMRFRGYLRGLLLND